MESLLSRRSSLGYGVRVNGKVKDCLQQAGLDYKVGCVPVRYIPDESTENKVVPLRYVTYNLDTLESFGVVGSSYTIIQNDALFGFLDFVSDFELTNGGTLKAGGWLCGKFPDEDICFEESHPLRGAWIETDMKTQKDVFTPYVFFHNSHDGTSRFEISFAPYVQSCGTFVHIPSSTYKVCVKHTKHADHKIQLAQGFVKQTTKSLDAFRSMVQETSAKLVSDQQAKYIFETITKPIDPTKKSKTADSDALTLWDYYNEHALAPYRGTGYGIVLAVSKFVQDILVTRFKKQEAFMKKAVFTTHPLVVRACQML